MQRLLLILPCLALASCAGFTSNLPPSISFGFSGVSSSGQAYNLGITIPIPVRIAEPPLPVEPDGKAPIPTKP